MHSGDGIGVNSPPRLSHSFFLNKNHKPKKALNFRQKRHFNPLRVAYSPSFPAVYRYFDENWHKICILTDKAIPLRMTYRYTSMTVQLGANRRIKTCLKAI